jgi:cellulose synthase (UDP-forming)
VFAIWDSARGQTMSWHPTRTPGSALGRFRAGILGWTGGTSLAWAALAVWRMVSLDPARFAVLAAFGLLNLALVGRVIFAGGRAS